LYDPIEIERFLSEYSDLIRQYAIDVPQGEFKVLPDIKSAIIKFKKTGRFQ